MLESQVSSIPEKSTNEGKGSKQLGGETARREDANEGLSSAIALVSDVGSASVSNQLVQDDDGLGDIWREMTMALEFSKDATSDSSTVRQDREECEHSLVLKDDIGYVCRICGVIQKSIETIFDFQWAKGSKSIRTYPVESCNKNNSDQTERTQISGYAESDYELMEEVCIHPRHREQMKGHQLEGFKFLVRNLIGEKPGGCILAHAPGSGKTFMVISFIQSFLAKYPHARPLVVLPKGILSTWKKEFKTWQIEEIPLYDFYTEKADNRSQQLEVLDQWVGTKSVLLLGYKQFASIVCGVTASKVEAACQERLLKVPSLLILDEGHTPRNENTDVLHSLDKVQTPRKVVLSGTLFQNHVREVFNILNLVRPKFLRLERSRGIVRRVLSKGEIPGGNRRHLKGAMESTFFDMVENTLQHEENLKMKVAVIKDLREMTRDVLHYYKGDFLEDLPGLVDFTVVLNLTEKQKASIQKSKKLDKFKRSSVNSGICMHPHLDELLKNASGECIDEDKIDRMIESSNINDGIKTKFFLNILGLAESAGEKVIVFSRYILPLKFLERVLIRLKGWRSGKEMFVISGDSNQENREFSMDKFNNSADAKVFFGSIKACGEGISLVGGSRILILDVHLNPSVTRQAIGRAYRPGQKKKVYTYRLVAAESPEEEDHITSFRKELISKMWFEWSEFCGTQGFDMEKVDLRNCEDDFLESSSFSEEDVKALYRR